MKMKLINLSLLFSLFLVSHNANAFNITQILTQYPDLSTFNNYLTQANLASKINSRETITVLAVDNANITPLSGKPLQDLTDILGVHVILDYFDVPKLQKLPKSPPTTITTLFQTTGSARGQQGFLNVTHEGTSSIVFVSAAAAAGSASGTSYLVKSVFSEPYNISVLQVNSVIVPPGVGSGGGPTNGGPAASPSGSQAPAVSPSASPNGSETPSISPSMSPNMSPQASPPHTAPPTSSRGPAPSEGPSIAEGPIGPHTHPAQTPSSSPIANAPIADAPVADAPAADAPAASAPAAADASASDSPSAATTLHVGLGVIYTVVGSTLCLASRV